jgi:thymidylate synthase (FAD)
MKIVEPSVTILFPDCYEQWESEFKSIELAARNAYKSEEKITYDSYKNMITMLLKRGHYGPLEFGRIIMHVITDRGISHEIVRHRHASYVQESTRYCNYGDKDIEFIAPSGINISEEDSVFIRFLEMSESIYKRLIVSGQSPQIARSVLPNCLKTEIVMTCNFRELLHIFSLRVLGKSGSPHPDMKKLFLPLYDLLHDRFSFIF